MRRRVATLAIKNKPHAREKCTLPAVVACGICAFLAPSVNRDGAVDGVYG